MIVRPVRPQIQVPTRRPIITGGYQPWEIDSGRSRVFLLDYVNGAGITFTRASEASAFDPRTGRFYSTAVPWPGANVRRVLADGSILIEGARTNAVGYSHELNQTGWGGGAVVGQNVTQAPDGLTTADRITIGAGVKTFNDHARRFFGALAGGTYAVSFFGKQGTQGSDAYVQTIDGTGVGTAYTLTSEWQRFVRHSSNTTAYIELFANGVGQGPSPIPTTANGDNIILWGAQMELSGIYPTSPIRSSGGPTTRASEVLTISSGNWNLYQDVWAIDVWPQYSSAEAGGNPVIMSTLSDNSYLQLVGASIQFVIGSVDSSIRPCTWSKFQRLNIRVDWPARTVTLNNFTTGDGTFAMPGVNTWGAAQAISIGSYLAGGLPFNGVVGRPWRV